MKMLFKQRMFSWFDSYDIYDEYGNTLFVVKGQLSWGHCLRIFDAAGCPVASKKRYLHGCPNLNSTQVRMIMWGA